MPELPEVETIKRALEQIIAGKKITGVIVHNAKVIKEPSLILFKKGIKGQIIKRIVRKGKALILELSSGKSLAIHLRMTGQLVYPGTGLKSRVSFVLSNKKLLDYNDQRLLGELKLVSNWRDIPFIKKLGPEPHDLTVKQFSSMLSKKTTKIKPLLMDQGFIAGIGNLYAAEVLFKSKINPMRKALSLSGAEKRKLFFAIKDILSKAIKHRGSSIDQYVMVSGRQGDYVRFHKVYDRKDEACYICRTPIKRVVCGGRGTYFCGRCQK